eukprot:scaffold1521_cov271-Chaetoceros_neogracile.AAC.90
MIHVTPFFALCFLSSQSFGTDALRPSQFGPGPSNLTPPSSRANDQNYAQSSESSYPPDYDYTNNNNNNNNNPLQESWIDTPPPMDHESVEERLESWRQQQQHRYEHQSQGEAVNPRDEDGKMKLLASVSKGSIAFFFFILMWRAVHHYELADQAFKGSTRLFMVLPTVFLFLGNLAGCVGSIMSNGALGKKRMKGILNLNKLMEISLMAYNVMRLVLAPSKLVVREVYVGRTLSNFLFLVQCQLFTKVTWNATQLNPNSLSADTTYGNLEGDYDEGQQYGNNDNLGHQDMDYENDQDNTEWR